MLVGLMFCYLIFVRFCWFACVLLELPCFCLCGCIAFGVVFGALLCGVYGWFWLGACAACLCVVLFNAYAMRRE